MPLRSSAISGQALGYYWPGNTPTLDLVIEVMVRDDRPPNVDVAFEHAVGVDVIRQAVIGGEGWV